MDRERFDALVRLLATPGSRRQALGALLGAALAGGSAEVLAKRGNRRGKRRDKGNDKDKKKDKDKRRDRKKARTEAIPAGCCSGGNCTPGPGKNLTQCCYEDQNLSGRSFKGGNLTGTNFTGANLTNAKFQSTNLTGACFVDANISGANFKGANQSGVIKCRTQTSTGIDNSGCDNGTECCQTCVPVNEQGCLIGGECCGGADCIGPAPGTCTCPADTFLCDDDVCQVCCVDEQCTNDLCCRASNNCCLGFRECTSGTSSIEIDPSGPGDPPRGEGSAELSVGSNGSGAAQLRSRDFAGTLLEDIDNLEYATYVQTAAHCTPGAGQAPYIILNLAFTNPVPNPNDPAEPFESDLIFFEPVYSQGSQGQVACNTWQTWNATNGGWWSVNGIAGANPGFGPTGTKTLAQYLAVVGTNNARITNGSGDCGGGLRIVTGFGAPTWDNFVGNVNFLEITVDGQEQQAIFG